MDRTSTTSTSLGHTWTIEDNNLMIETEYTTLFQDTFIKYFRDLIFMRPICEETSERLVQAILDYYSSICQNNPFLSQNNTQLSLSNEIPLNNLSSHNSDPEPLLQTQNQNTTSNLSSNNQKHNSSSHPISSLSLFCIFSFPIRIVILL